MLKCASRAGRLRCSPTPTRKFVSPDVQCSGTEPVACTLDWNHWARLYARRPLSIPGRTTGPKPPCWGRLCPQVSSIHDSSGARQNSPRSLPGPSSGLLPQESRRMSDTNRPQGVCRPADAGRRLFSLRSSAIPAPSSALSEACGRRSSPPVINCESFDSGCRIGFASLRLWGR